MAVAASIAVGGAAVAGGIASGVGGVVAANKQGNAAKRAAELQAQAQQLAQEQLQQQEAFNRAQFQNFLARTNQFNQGFQPFIQQGQQALGGINDILSGKTQFQLSSAARQAIQSGSQTVQASAAARGMLNSGNTVQALQQVGQNLAQSDLDRQRQERLQVLMQMANQGFAAQSSQRVIGPYQSQIGSQISNLALQGAQAQGVALQQQAQASGAALQSGLGMIGGVGNAFSGALGFYQGQQLNDALNNQISSGNTDALVAAFLAQKGR